LNEKALRELNNHIVNMPMGKTSAMISALLLTAQPMFSAPPRSLYLLHGRSLQSLSIKPCHNAEPPGGGNPSPERLRLRV
jgi:hypothetical protein